MAIIARITLYAATVITDPTWAVVVDATLDTIVFEADAVTTIAIDIGAIGSCFAGGAFVTKAEYTLAVLAQVRGRAVLIGTTGWWRIIGAGPNAAR